MAVWSEVDFRVAARTSRLDPEYFQPHFLEAEALLARLKTPIVRLGNLVTEGYRVVYENTEIILEPFEPEKHVKYLQATNISSDFPVIRDEEMGWVNRADWERYEKGRIRRGELLVEVKGKAKKVTLVPNDFSEEVLVSGTLYKMTLDESQVDRRYVLIYLLGKFGTSFRERSKSNILVSYVSKDELYNIPVPVASTEFQMSIVRDYLKVEERYLASQSLYAEAETLLLDALGLNDLDTTNALAYEANFRDAAAAGRFDTNYFQPKYARVRQALSRLPNCQIVPLKAVLSELTNGQTPLRHDLSMGEVSFLTAEHVDDFQLDLTSEKRVMLEHHNKLLQRTQLRLNDVLITILLSKDVLATLL